MANRWGNQFTKRLDTNTWVLDGYVVLDHTTGAVLANSAVPAGIKAFTGGTWARTGTGTFELTLEDAWPALIDWTCKPAFAANLADLKAVLVSSDVITTKKIVIKFVAVATAADFPKEAGFFASIVLKNSGLPAGS